MKEIKILNKNEKEIVFDTIVSKMVGYESKKEWIEEDKLYRYFKEDTSYCLEISKKQEVLLRRFFVTDRINKELLNTI